MGGRADGVEVRPGSIRIFFVWNGERCKETVTLLGKPVKPTPPNVIDARRKGLEIRKRLERGTFDLAEFFPDSPRNTKPTSIVNFGQMCAMWLASKGRLAPKTLTQYGNALKVWKGIFGAATPIAAITPGTVESKVGSHPWASNKLLNNYLICLRGVFGLAARELLIANPTVAVENGKHQAPLVDPLGREEMEAVLVDMEKHYPVQVWAYFVVAFLTGMRPEEIIALRWGDVDWRAAEIRVERAKSGGKIGPLKTYQVRDVELVTRAVTALEAMKKITYMKGDDTEIFQNPVTGLPWHDERSQRDHYWVPAMRRCKVRARRAYNTRHTYATLHLLAEANPSYVSRQMGHKNAKLLFTTYGKWIDRSDRGREKAKFEALTSEPSSLKVPQEPGRHW